MTNVRLALRVTASFAALMTAWSAASAQSILPPQGAAANPATVSTAAAGAGEEIVVTGSRIRRDPLSQEQPIVFVDKGDIDRTGLNSINDVLQRLPSSGGGLNGKFNNSGNLGNPPDGGGVGAGAAEIDLRYLGSKRVLVLVDGLRFVNGSSASGVPGSTDLNAIPDSMIERVEVLQDGASAVYGSDAIAGVVNIITKHQQKGLVASGQLGGYGQGDGFSQNYQLSWGNGTSGPTKIVIGGNFVQTNGVLAGDRAISAFPQPYSTTCLDGGCSSYPLNGRFDVLGQSLTLNKPIAGRPTYPTDFKDFTTADRFNYAPYNFIETPVKRYGLFAELKQELGPDLNFSAKGIWNERKSANQAAYLPLAIGPDAGNGNLLDTITVSATNPYNPFGVDLVPGVNYQQIKRRVIEGGLRTYDQTVKTIYGSATLDGKFAIGRGEWFWDVNASYGRNRAAQVMHGNINAQRLQQALGPVANCTGACVPFNFFGTPGSISQAMLDYVGFVQRDSSEQKTWDATANISGHLFDLPGGPLGLAAGLEYRDLKGRFDPDPIVAAGFGSDIPAQPT
ncbi:MAG: TonB-dependent receptor plug domain-containing protein, partial [Pseudomonadota bacterium]|nr:TonB-dependent receptor plug domain-containing protein [Pseudomonadota bacterium]